MLRKRILQTLEKQSTIDQRKLARIAGLSESSISRYLHGYEEANFESVLKMVKELYPEKEVEEMAEYVITQKSRNARYSLEYCLMNHLTKEFNQLLKVLEASTNPLDKEWAGMYSLLRTRNEKILPSAELLNLVEVFKPKSLEMRVLKSIIKAYIYFDMNEYQALVLHIHGVESLIEDIKNNFIKKAFKVRLGLIMTYVCFYANKIERARYYSSIVIDQDYFENVKGTAYHQLGHTYLYESYDESIKYLQKALDHFNKAGIEDYSKTTTYTIEFVKSYWKIDREYTLELDNYKHIINFVYYLIQKEDKIRAKEIMNQVDLDTLPDWEKGFYFYYQGLINNSKDSFYDSVEWFKRTGNSFHLFLSLKELYRLNENKRLLKLLAT